MTDDARTTRRREHFRDLADAGLRAATGRPGLHHRGADLWEGSRRLPAPAVHLHPDPDATLTSLRGISDAVSLRLQLSDASLHAARRPEHPAARTIFDLLEQLRVESLVPDSAPGARRNMAARFEDWSDEFLGSGLAETELGLMVFALAHTARSRILAVRIPEALEDTLEHTRFSMAERTGAHLRMLRRLRHDQTAFAEPALELSAIAAELAEEAAEKDATARGENTGGSPRFALFERDDDSSDDDVTGPVPLGSSRTLLQAGGVYRVFTSKYDETVDATGLVRAPVLRRLRQELDLAVAQRGLDIHGLGLRLERALATPSTDGWDSGQEEGRLDGSRLAQLVATPSSTLIFRTDRIKPVADVALTLLIDCSGSMRTHQFPVASAVDALARAADAIGMSVEVLGFTTRSWSGGRARKDWTAAGSPAGAGRVAERRHAVLLSGDEGYRRGRAGIAALLRNDLYKEGLDGEALDWACSRISRRSTRRRVVVVISDGSPSEAATAAATDEDYLGAHLRRVVDRWAAEGTVEVAGLGVGLDLSLYYDRHRTVDPVEGDAAGVIAGIFDLLARR